jgi:hypothetical protein
MCAPTPRARDVRVTSATLKVFLVDGRSIRVPLTHFPRLDRATRQEQRGWRLRDEGQGIRWDAINVDVSVVELLATGPRPRAMAVRLTQEDIRLTLTDWRQLWVPLRWFPQLHKHPDILWGRWRWVGDGEGLHWEEIDLYISVASVLAR